MAELWRFLKLAYNLKLGMPLPPNWVVSAFLLLISLKFPVIALLGFALQVVFVFLTGTSHRFQNVIKGQDTLEANKKKREEIEEDIRNLPLWANKKYAELRNRCTSVVQDQNQENSPDISTVTTIISQLLFIYFRLLKTWVELDRLIRSTDYDTVKQMKIQMASLQKKIDDKETAISYELRSSYDAQIKILQARIDNQESASAKLQYVTAECSRIEMQIDLIREQAALSSDAQTVSAQVNALSTGMAETSKWISNQQSVLGDLAGDMNIPNLLETN